MSTIYVQFSDVNKTVVTTVFGCAQDAMDFPNQGQIDSSDARYQAFINPSTTPAGLNAALLAQIIALESGQSRAVREATIGTAGAIDRLKSLDARITGLRSQLTK